ncbi:MAG: pyrroline-5-carboxylate reductase [Thermoanaerobaculia bacterium]
MKNARIVVLGMGMMGRTIAEGVVRAGQPKRSIAGTTRTRASATRLTKELGIAVGSDNVAAVADADIVVFALKPMQVLEVAQELAAASALPARALVVSIAAGVTTTQLEEILGARAAVVRAMPNTPCSIGCGTTVITPGKRASEAHLATARRIFSPLGRVLELQEKHMDTATGLSASGPAFVYVILEALADGGVARGLPRQTAIEMAAQMVYGAASMVLVTGRHPAALKDDVTTPAGCTIAGILALEDGRIRSVLSRAVEVASVRAGELATRK